MGKFNILDNILKPILWKRGNFRFTKLKLIDNNIHAGGYILDTELRVIKRNNEIIGNKYCIKVMQNNVKTILYLNSNCNFEKLN